MSEEPLASRVMKERVMGKVFMQTVSAEIYVIQDIDFSGADIPIPHNNVYLMREQAKDQYHPVTLFNLEKGIEEYFTFGVLEELFPTDPERVSQTAVSNLENWKIEQAKKQEELEKYRRFRESSQIPVTSGEDGEPIW